MGKRKILLELDTELFDSIKLLKDSVISDDDVTFFKIHTCSDQSWFRYVVKMGVIKIKNDLERWKKESV